jgi:hypothetical protein
VISSKAAAAAVVRSCGFSAGDGGEGRFGRKEEAHKLVGFGWRRAARAVGAVGAEEGVGVKPPSPPRDTCKVVDCRWGVIEIRNSKVQGIRNFRHVQATESVIPYILCGGLYCLRWCDVWRGSLPTLL